jgi:hypothetical protein
MVREPKVTFTSSPKVMTCQIIYAQNPLIESLHWSLSSLFRLGDTVWPNEGRPNVKGYFRAIFVQCVPDRRLGYVYINIFIPNYCLLRPIFIRNRRVELSEGINPFNLSWEIRGSQCDPANPQHERIVIYVEAWVAIGLRGPAIIFPFSFNGLLLKKRPRV